MNKNAKHFCRILGTLLLLQAVSYSQSVPSTPAGSYSLRYKVQNLTARPDDKPGELQLVEEHGRLKCTCTGAGVTPYIFLFDGKMSFISASDDQATLFKGFQYQLVPLRLFLPFNFGAHRVIDGIDRGLVKLPVSKRTEGRQKVPECNVSVFLTSSKDGLDAFTVSTLQALADGSQELRVGAERLPWADYKYSKFVSFKSARIPGEIVIKQYDHVLGPDKQSISVVRGSYKMVLDKVSEPELAQGEMEVQGHLKPGMLVSYVGDKGEGGVKYDPTSGTFADQLSKQMEIANRHYGQLIQGGAAKSAESSSSRIPIVLSAVFALLAIVLLIVGRRKMKAHG